MDDKTREQAWNTIKDFGGSALDFGKSALGTVGDWISDWWNDGSSEENKPKPESESKGGFLDMVSGMVFGKAEASPKKNDKDKTTDTIIKVKDKLVKDNKEIEKYIDTLENQLDEYKQEQANLVKELADSGENADDKKEIADALAACADKIKTTNNRIGELKEQQASNTTQLQEQADALGIDIKEFTSATKDSIIEKVDENSAATNKFIEKKHQQSNEIYKKLSSIVGKDLAEKIVTAGDHILYTDILGFGSLSEIIEKIFDMTNQLLEKAGVKKYSLLQGDGFGAKFLRGGLRLAASGVGIFSDTGASLLRGTANINEFDGMDATTATLFGGLETYAAGSVQKAIEYLSGDSGFIEWAAAQGITMAMLHSKTYEDIKRMVAKYQKERATMREKVQNGDYIPDSEKTAYTYELYRREAAKKLKTAKASGDQEAIKKAQEELRINELAAQSGGDIVGARQKFEKEQAEKVANGGKDLGDRAKDAMDQTVDTAKEYGEKAANMAFGTAEAASSEDRPETKAESERSREKTTGDATKKITDQQKKEQELSKQRNKQLEDMAELHERLMGMFQASVKEEHGNLWKMMAITQDILVDMKATVARAGAFVATAAQTGGSGGNAGGNGTVYTGGVTQSMINAYKELLEYSPKIREIVDKAAKKYGLPKELIAAVMKHESDFGRAKDTYGGNPYGYGLMQINPQAHGYYRDDESNVDKGAELLKNAMDSYGGNIALALNGYNAGGGGADDTLKKVKQKYGDIGYDNITPAMAMEFMNGESREYTRRIVGEDAINSQVHANVINNISQNGHIDTSNSPYLQFADGKSWDGSSQATINFANAVANAWHQMHPELDALLVTSAKRHGGGDSHHDHGEAFDVANSYFDNKQLRTDYVNLVTRLGGTPLDEWEGEPGAVYANGNNIHVTTPGANYGNGGVFDGTNSNIQLNNMSGNIGATIEQYERIINNGKPENKEEYHRRAKFAMSNHAAQIQYTGKRDTSVLEMESVDSTKDDNTDTGRKEKKKTYKILDSDKELEAAEYLKYYGVSTGNLDESTIEKLADRLQRTHSLD
ncbi:MAG: transglycosylase SLT domain-containing protein, partial [Bacilli bacterium]|nr:transglycosylase SLT domain-containing protein [Bacilli bacterium]